MNVLTPDEVAMTQMALSSIMEDMQAARMNPKYPFTPEARKQMNEMFAVAQSAHNKLAKASGKSISIDPFKDGDEKEFLTKES